MAKVKIIPSTINPLTQMKIGSTEKRKVAAYARVSTDQEEQLSSYDAQVKFYTEYIEKRDDWTFVKVYSDEGVSGTSTKKRDGFNLMISDAREGKIDLIITKSISRFARNTLDTLSYIRELKSKGIEVYFEKENLWTLDSKSELILTIMSSIAQEESRSISENVRWGKRASYKEGNVSFGYKRFLGYKKNKETGKIEIDEDQAKVVRFIYQSFLRDGKTVSWIADYLTEMKVPTPGGKEVWGKAVIKSILTNEKYKGQAILQKTYCDDYLTHEFKVNDGVLPKYHVEDSHPAIIEIAMWDEVQLEIARRRKLGNSYSSTDIFAAKLICEDCGAFYGAKLWHSTDAYAKTIYQCNHKFQTKNKEKCKTPNLSEEDIKEKFIDAYNKLMANKDALMEDIADTIAFLTDTADLDEKISAQENEIEIVNGLVQNMVKANCSKIQSQDEYSKKYEELSKRYEKTKKLLESLMEEKEHKKKLAMKLNNFMNAIKDQDGFINYFDDGLFRFMVENIKVHRDKSLTFKFYNGKEISIK